MKIRVMGTKDECTRMILTVKRVVPSEKIRNISAFYPNRGITTEGRIYLEIDE
jgi:hypothetical protein